jgi:hypothetical protein
VEPYRGLLPSHWRRLKGKPCFNRCRISAIHARNRANAKAQFGSLFAKPEDCPR